MARQITRPRERGAVSPPAAPKSPRRPWKSLKTTFTQIPASPIARPFRPANATKVVEKSKPKTKPTVSAASVFKKQSKSKSTRASRKHRNRRAETPEPDLLSDLKDGFAEARTTMGNKTRATFDEIHAGFADRLATDRAEDETFFETIATSVAILTTPLYDEQIQAEMNKDGKRVFATHQVGDRVNAFKTVIKEEEAKLNDLWKQWNDVQDEYLELGAEVFGWEASGKGEASEKGFKKEMDLLGLEHGARVEEVEEMIEDIGPDILKKTKASEKELASTAKAEQAKLLQTMLF
ncbi:hypothetical protein PZA11_003631 [Diplocarpon coronariae]|uniref:Uncharacterized protein n=1 Tax=Diplocarpon coronariae TaxID=2795749 RepID=A0A218ZFG3_9HELO|nr:hypothetical protein JHW43_006862 [Diplocarpon mali]OWP06831.1 hypothetical protein B2J93_3827 [Marssonina coronariae]